MDDSRPSAHLTVLRPEQRVFYLDRYAATNNLRQQVTGLVSNWPHTHTANCKHLQHDAIVGSLLQFQVKKSQQRASPGELEELEAQRG